MAKFGRFRDGEKDPFETYEVTCWSMSVMTAYE